MLKLRLLLFSIGLFCKIIEARDVLEELFGTGLFQNNDRNQHISSSTSDLLTLFETEKRFLKSLAEIKSSLPKDVKAIVNQYLKETDHQRINISSEEYVFHPINTFHMLRRASKWFPILVENIPELDTGLTIPTKDEVIVGAAHGLADIQEHYNLNVNDLIQGKIVDSVNGQVYKSVRNLSSTEALLIAKEARDVKYLEGQVRWLKGALKAAKSEKKPKGVIDRIKSQLNFAIDEHDSTLQKMPNLLDQAGHGFLLGDKMFKRPKKEIGRIKVNDTLLEDLESSDSENLLTRDEFKEQTQQKLNHVYRRKIQQLCKGIFQRRPEHIKDLNCFFVNKNNPYLRLGPFKYEMMNRNPEVGLFHQLASQSQVRNIVSNAQPHLKPTPFIVGKKTEPYSKLRTSKVMYLNEHLWDAAKTLSNTLQNATGFSLYKTPHDSENFQAMNYGMGGKISGHWDTIGHDSIHKSTEVPSLGGRRFVTMMTYLTGVEAGGRTVFPQLGISVKPESGSTLYWFSIGPQDNMDTRAIHLGCPVLFGNKWIVNKWVKWIAQQKKFSCSHHKTYFSVVNAT